MAFFSGLIVGLLAGASSWLLAAAWLETQRMSGKGADTSGDDFLTPPSFDYLHKQPSRS